jgi:hypothetical protein
VPAAGLHGERVVMVAAGFGHTVALGKECQFQFILLSTNKIIS